MSSRTDGAGGENREMSPQNRPRRKKQRVLIARPCSLNLLSGNVSSPAFTRVPLVTNTTRLPLVTGGVPFSLTRGLIGRRQAAGAPERVNRLYTDNAGCPWCGASDIRPEMKSGKRALWGCLGCQRRWWASLDDPAKVVRARPRLGQKTFKSGVWHMFGGFGQ